VQLCGDEASLRVEVESLLDAIDQASGFIERPACESLTSRSVIRAGWIPDLGRRAMEPGRLHGPYTILEFVDAGGMGEVYRAHDRNLNRDVALKVRPAAFALDADRYARFRREAQIVASLNHPNIAAIYGLEESDGIQALSVARTCREGRTADLSERRPQLVRGRQAEDRPFQLETIEPRPPRRRSLG
jgi:serine/threonine protein kinase